MRIAPVRQAKRTVFLVLACVSAQALFSEPPQPAGVSSFAPADDLLEQVDFFIARLEDALSDPADFDGAKQSRAWKDSNTLAALALLLSAHDEKYPVQSSMPTLLRGAQALAAAEDNVERAQQALAQIKAARAGTAQADAAIPATKVAALPALMKQVPLVHAALRRGVAPGRLERMAKQSAGQSATLAAIAQAAMLDDEYAATAEESAAWKAFCTEMRDAAGDVNTAVHAQDQGRVDAGMTRLLESCDACHAKFREQ